MPHLRFREFSAPDLATKDLAITEGFATILNFSRMKNWITLEAFT